MKPGDTVKTLSSVFNGDHEVPPGTIGTVVKVDEHARIWPIEVEFDDHPVMNDAEWVYSTSELELVDSLTQEVPEGDPVKKPSHYRQVPGIECIDVIKHFNFPVGSAIKYLWRHEHKGDPIENLRKAIENIEFEIARRQSGEG